MRQKEGIQVVDKEIYYLTSHITIYYIISMFYCLYHAIVWMQEGLMYDIVLLDLIDIVSLY